LQIDLRLKTEVYYQLLFNVPISTSDTNTFSVLNIQGDYTTDPLVKSAEAELWIEFTGEILSKAYYYMINYSSLPV